MEARPVTTLVCRQCHTDLDVSAAVCHRCGTPTRESGSDTRASKSDERLLDRPWFLIVLVLHLGIIGIPAYWKTKYSAATRLLIIAASILYTAFAIVVIVWSLMTIASLF